MVVVSYTLSHCTSIIQAAVLSAVTCVNDVLD